MAETDPTIELQQLRIELARIVIATTRIRHIIDHIEERNINEDTTNDDISETTYVEPAAAEPIPPNDPTDRDGNLIIQGNRVTFLTQGKFGSTEGTIVRFSIDKKNVFAEDNTGEEIARRTTNVRLARAQPMILQDGI